jgi:hypothetical protein
MQKINADSKEKEQGKAALRCSSLLFMDSDADYSVGTLQPHIVTPVALVSTLKAGTWMLSGSSVWSTITPCEGTLLPASFTLK